MLEYTTILRDLHLLGVIMGFGGAIYADYLMLTRGVLRPLDTGTLRQVAQLSHIVMIGLAVLWISGVFLTVDIVAENPRFWTNDKFWAKVTMVGLLTLNGFVVHQIVLKHVEGNLGRKLLINGKPVVTLGLLVSGAVSFVSWTLPFILGNAPELSYVVPYLHFMAIWIFAVMAVVAGLGAGVAILSKTAMKTF